MGQTQTQMQSGASRQILSHGQAGAALAQWKFTVRHQDQQLSSGRCRAKNTVGQEEDQLTIEVHCELNSLQ